MTRKKSSCLLIFGILGIIMLFSTDRVFNATTTNALRENHQEPDQKLVDYFFHENGIEGSKAILERGEKIIPYLMKLKGRRDFWFPLGLGNPDAAKLWKFPVRQKGDKQDEGKSVYDADGDVITQEIAALYLICAIYHGNLRFAETPLLTDLSLPPEERRDRNTKELVDRAWAAVEIWSESLKKDGLASLRANHYDPLKGSKVAFW